MQHFLKALLLVFSGMISGCSVAPSGRCASVQELMASELLYFGTAKPNGVVSEQDWSEFLQSVLTPLFPAGLTVWQASGRWKAADGSISREASYVLNVVHPGSEAAEAAIRSVVSEYKARFQQESVLRVKGAACVSF
jgi:Protein of unknown function (DUF3574)